MIIIDNKSQKIIVSNKKKRVFWKLLFRIRTFFYQTEIKKGTGTELLKGNRSCTLGSVF